MKKLKAAFIAALALALLLAVGALADGAEDFTIDADGVLTAYSGAGGDVVIPDGVVKIGREAFRANRAITRVTIPEGVAELGQAAFADCINLTEVVLPETGLARIETNCFQDSTRLASIVIPEGVTYLGSSAFEGCSRLASVSLPSTLAGFNSMVFYRCGGLQGFSVSADSQTMKAVDGVLFSKDGKTLIRYPGAREATVYTVPAGVEALSTYAFNYSGVLEKVILPEGLTAVTGYCFVNCTQLEAIVIPASVSRIGGSAFSQLRSLTKLRFEHTAEPCEMTGMLNGIDTEGLVIECRAGSAAEDYAQTNGLTVAYIKPEFTVDDNGVLNAYNGEGGDVTVPASVDGVAVTAIGANAFYGNESITAVALPEGLRSVERHAFYGCASLARVDLPDSLATIGGEAFNNCGQLELELPDNITGIDAPDNWNPDTGCYDFGCKKVWLRAGTQTAATYCGVAASNGLLSFYSHDAPDYQLIQEERDGQPTIILARYTGSAEHITTPAAVDGVPVRQIGRDSSPGSVDFMDFHGVRSVTVSEGAEVIAASVFSNTEVESVTLPESLRAIGDYAFSSCMFLQGIDIPSGVTTIGVSAFNCCPMLEEITLPGSLETVRESAFMSSGLKRIVLPEGLKTIAAHAFGYCYELARVNLPSSLESVDATAFESCDKLLIEAGYDRIAGLWHGDYTGKYISPDAPDWIVRRCTVDGAPGVAVHGYLGGDAHIVMPDEIDALPVRMLDITYDETGEHSAFKPANPTQVTLTANLRTIGYQAFNGCRALEFLEVPEGVTTISDDAFIHSGIHFLRLPDSAESIGSSYTTGVSADGRQLTVYCYSMTEAQSWANNYCYNLVLLDGATFDEIGAIVAPESLKLLAGETAELEPTLFPTMDQMPTLSYATGDADVATVDGQGVVTAVGMGSTDITIAAGSVTTTVRVDVSVALTGLEFSQREYWLEGVNSLRPEVIPAPAGASVSLSWAGDSDNIATVDPTSGTVTGRRVGDVVVTATDETGISVSCTVHVTHPVTAVSVAPASMTVLVGEAVQLTATATTRGGNYVNKLVRFDVSDPGIVDVDQSGLAIATGVGIGSVQAISMGGKSGQCDFTVLDPYTDFDFKLPAGTVQVDEEAFEGLAAIRVACPEGLAAIGSRAFAECGSLEMIYIPNADISLAADAFDGCPAALRVYGPAGSVAQAVAEAAGFRFVPLGR